MVVATFIEAIGKVKRMGTVMREKQADQSPGYCHSTEQKSQDNAWKTERKREETTRTTKKAKSKGRKYGCIELMHREKSVFSEYECWRKSKIMKKSGGMGQEKEGMKQI